MEIKTSNQIFADKFCVLQDMEYNPFELVISKEDFEKLSNQEWVAVEAIKEFIERQKDFADLTAFELWVRLQEEIKGKKKDGIYKH